MDNLCLNRVITPEADKNRGKGRRLILKNLEGKLPKGSNSSIAGKKPLSFVVE
jgi:hypothetical protein